MAEVSSFAALSNGALLAETKHLAANERGSTVALILALSEVDSRRLYLSEGHSCMFYYCTVELHLSESAAYRRIEVARVARVFPQILEALKRGGLNLTTAVTIAPHLTPSNVDALIAAASFKKKEDVRLLIARLHPKPDVPTVLRKQPAHRVAVATNGSGGAFAFEASTVQTVPPPFPLPTPMRSAAAVSPALVAPLSATRTAANVPLLADGADVPSAGCSSSIMSCRSLPVEWPPSRTSSSDAARITPTKQCSFSEKKRLRIRHAQAPGKEDALSPPRPIG